MQTKPIGAPGAWLAAELGERRSKNERYSLRSLARKLQLSPGRLSEFISGKRAVTFEQAVKIAERLEYDPSKRQDFLSSVLRQPRKPDAKKIAYRAMSSDVFHVIADWYHIAILSLMDTTDFESDHEWIARRLNISKTTVKAAISRLTRVGLLTIENGKLNKIDGDLATTDDVVSPALRLSHRQSLIQASDALDTVAIENRDVTSITMAIDVTKIPEAKRMIKAFRRRLCRTLEAGEQTEVYNLNVQLVPVTILRPQKENPK